MVRHDEGRVGVWRQFAVVLVSRNGGAVADGVDVVGAPVLRVRRDGSVIVNGATRADAAQGICIQLGRPFDDSVLGLPDATVGALSARNAARMRNGR